MAGLNEELTSMLLELVRASGFGLLRGRVVIPTSRLNAVAKQATAKVKVVESIDLVPTEGEVRMHLVLNLMNSATRVVVRAAIASFHLSGDRGALRLRLLEPPTFAGKNGGKAPGMLGMVGAFGEAALTSMGPEGIARTVAEFIGGPLSALGDMLSIDLGSILQVKQALLRQTPVGRIGDAVHVSGARFRPGGLEIGLQLRTRSIFGALRSGGYVPRLPPAGRT